jgi:RimJ/RimL family protein N-acetyltransferase
MPNDSPVPPPVLQTERLRLREFCPNDAAFILALLNSPGWLQHIGPRGVNTLIEAETWIQQRLMPHYASHGYGFWLVERSSDAQALGLCGLIHRHGLDQPDLGYALLPEHEGRGYARESAVACLDHGHGVLAMATVLAITSAENARSARLLADIGMHEVPGVTLPGETALLRCFASHRRCGGTKAGGCSQNFGPAR